MADHVAGAFGDQSVGYVKMQDIVRPTKQTTNGDGGLGDVDRPRCSDAILHRSSGHPKPNIRVPQYDLDDVTVRGGFGAKLFRPPVVARMPSRGKYFRRR